ncbi:hydantoinase B/oxoprolinase family protein [Candidatus Solirubrobacter pratensis]|uniref:hydantoinase B/oxoprolinase family protein n=1 Tax=Candidatus Solirubrobacter pratensis TaxID=1298857 RepID=UPI0004269C2C|nr:hydantoinase B/oxoprolinase family protein [Candidatus Solirubrobacter pratensis]
MTSLAADPITLEIIQEALQATGDEMFAVLRKTAMSAIIYEVLDAGTGVTDRHGELASAGAGIPTFVGVLDKAVRRIIELHAEIRPGDVFVTNDPFYGGVTHLNDVVLALPVFADGELIAWTATIAHFNDVGGMVPGSISNEASEIFQEGLRLPAVKLFDEGRAVEPVLEIMKVNSRLPDFLHGDLWAEVAAVRLGERRVLELARKYGVDTFLTAVEELLAHGERVMRRALAELPEGRYELAEPQDDGKTYRVAVEIGGGEFVVDLRDNPEQDRGSANVSRDGAVIAAQMALMTITQISGSASSGHFVPLRVLTRPGTVFDPAPEAACSIYSEVRIRLFDVILRCLAPHLGDRLPAGGFTSVCGTFISGRHPDTGRHFTIVEPQVGGWGASARRDGNSAMFSPFHGDTFNCPAEIAEARYGLFVDRLALNLADGGEGRFRGGKGIVLEYRVRANGCSLTCAYTRSANLPWSLAGGAEGSANFVEVVRARDGARERYAVASMIPLAEGDVVRINTGSGAGYGDPRERPRELVVADLRDGLLAERHARDVYGPVV